MSRILVLGRLRRVDYKFEVTLGYTGEREFARQKDPQETQYTK